MKFTSNQPWYHGSPLELSILRKGSTITQKRELARIFSHKPTIVSLSHEGQVKHNGTISGYLYNITNEIKPEDVTPHPQSTMEEGDEWITTCELCLQLLCVTELVPSEQLTEDNYVMLRDILSKQE